jgi:cation transporter-like permease
MLLLLPVATADACVTCADTGRLLLKLVLVMLVLLPQLMLFAANADALNAAALSTVTPANHIGTHKHLDFQRKWFFSS